MTIETIESLPHSFQQELEKNDDLAKIWTGKRGPKGSEDSKAYRRDQELISCIKKAGLVFTFDQLELILSSFPHGLIAVQKNEGIVIYEKWSGFTQDYVARVIFGVGYYPLTYSTAEDLRRVIGKTHWTAKGWMAKGLATLLFSSPGLGKTRIAADVSKRILFPEWGWFDGQPLQSEPGSKIVWCDTEAFQGGLLAIIESFGIPENKIIFPFDDPLREVRLDRSDDLEQLERAIRGATSALLVVDSLRGSHRREENTSGEMQNILSNLSKMVQKCNTNCLATHHTNKPSPGDPDIIDSVHRVRGSSAIAANFRIVWALDQPNPNSDLLRLHIIKNNLAPKGNPLGLRITETAVDWTDAVPQRPRRKTKVDEAKDFVRKALRDGPRRSKELDEEAEQKGISKSALRRASESLGVKREKKGDHWEWELKRGKATFRPSAATDEEE